MALVHIHLHRAATRDAGFDESKVKRDDGGKFTAGGMNAAQHKTASEHHEEARKNLDWGHPDRHTHAKASGAHEAAALYLNSAKLAQEKGAHPILVGSHLDAAESHAKEAAAHTAKISPAKKDSPQNVKLQLEGRKQQLAELQQDMKTGKYSPEDMKILKGREESLKNMIGNYEAKSATPAPAGPSPQDIAKHSGKKVQASKPGWALRADPELAAKFEAAQKRSQARKLERETGKKPSHELASEAYRQYVEARNQGDTAKAQHFLSQHDKHAAAAKRGR